MCRQYRNLSKSEFRAMLLILTRIERLSRRKIIINSAMINPVGNERRGEWISLLNRGNRKIKVKDWTIRDGKGRQAKLPGSISSGNSLRLKGKKKGKIQLSN